MLKLRPSVRVLGSNEKETRKLTERQPVYLIGTEKLERKKKFPELNFINFCNTIQIDS